MAAINDLIAQVSDDSLREKLEREVNKLSKQKKFGLVFESHLPEGDTFRGGNGSRSVDDGLYISHVALNHQ